MPVIPWRLYLQKVWDFLTGYSLLLVIGAVLALIWANSDSVSYHHFVDYVLISDFVVGHPHELNGVVTRDLTVQFLINEVLMAFFFAIAAKEVWEGIILKDGELRGKKALTPLIATVGGMAGPVAVYLALAAFWGVFDATAQGWAIPTATDIAFSYLVGRLVFGAGHPAIKFLLLLAIADDAGGLIILAIFYPTGDLAPVWLVLSVVAALAAYLLANWLPQRLDRGDQERPWSTWARTTLSFWPYAIAGALSWYAFYRAGIHPALGLIPIIPAIPHADRAFGIFAEEETYQTDLLNVIEHGIKKPVEALLFFFGLANAGVVFSAISEPTWLVFFGLLIGKPVGILLFGWFAAKVLRLGLPDGMRISDLVVLGCVAGIGFTVALFVSTVAFPPGDIQDAAKMGALFSFASAITAIIAGRLFGVIKVEQAAAARV
jgi:Na+:H+ antiporter, NhaA family